MESRSGAGLRPADRLERDVNALIKRILTDYEELAEQTPLCASEPTVFNNRRRAVVRAVWELIKHARQPAEPYVAVTDLACPHCAHAVRVTSQWTGTEFIVTHDVSPYADATTDALPPVMRSVCDHESLVQP